MGSRDSGNGTATLKQVDYGDCSLINAGGRFSTNGGTIELFKEPLSDSIYRQRPLFILSEDYVHKFIHTTNDKIFGEEEFVFVLKDTYPNLAKEGIKSLRIVIQNEDVLVMKAWLLGCWGQEGVYKRKATVPRLMANRYLCPLFLSAYSTTTKVTVSLFAVAFLLRMAQDTTAFLGVCPREGGFPRTVCQIIHVDRGGGSRMGSGSPKWEPRQMDASLGVVSYDPTANDRKMPSALGIVTCMSAVMWGIRFLKLASAYAKYFLPKFLGHIKPWKENPTEEQHRCVVEQWWERSETPQGCKSFPEHPLGRRKSSLNCGYDYLEQ